MDIDGVFSGGGIKGFALIGAYEALESRGFTFKCMAATSAGSIMAAFIAAGYTSKEIAAILKETEMKDFLDSRHTLLPFPIAKWLLLYWRMGMYQGYVLEEWLAKKMAAKGIYTFSDLPKNKLRLIASDLSGGRLLVLPDDLELYGIPKETFPVARAIRMSCGLPFFFEPVKLRSLSGENIIVDGGLLSNFPMWVFEDEKQKLKRPVIGIKLSHKLEEQPKRKIKNGLQLFEALFETMKDAHDDRYISRKHEKNIIFIPMGKEFVAEFTLSNEKKDALIKIGRIRAEQFLKTWTY
ncbi:patatin-like phospholipase family protein [Lederbergia citrea]|uniref:Patatin-like phospholipase family protein n=1 Tax=Lederbergia citrea TaxID=2833581 RepID=A0A942UJ47_9BACI|nr:patatin-like phospholipase family protein [Lederbergia citrea]MBS4176367.1 patatin-like phospholipase family protein [Lederbergia citrea]MBS4202928.1 patatin-like phospholipase family protein [Lederbergia citrea]MBS4222400.1 patatin-like phospholipase family protein [Lederbergia citrea]